MISARITSNIDSVDIRMRRAAGSSRGIAMASANRLVYIGRQKAVAGLKVDLDRIKPTNARNIRYQRAKRPGRVGDSTGAKVFVNSRPGGKKRSALSDVLIALVEGRSRRYQVFGKGRILVPVAKFVEDRYGNVSKRYRKRIVKAIIQRKTQASARFTKSKRSKAFSSGVHRRVFARPLPGGLGVFEERKSGQTILLAFAPKRATWRKNTYQFKRWTHDFMVRQAPRVIAQESERRFKRMTGGVSQSEMREILARAEARR